jgi:hypothetical protein
MGKITVRYGLHTYVLCRSTSAAGVCSAFCRLVRASSPKPSLFRAGDAISSSSCAHDLKGIVAKRLGIPTTRGFNMEAICKGARTLPCATPSPVVTDR